MSTRPTGARDADRARGAAPRDLADRLRRAAGEPLTTRAAVGIVSVAGLAAAILLLWNFRDLIFFYDEWDFVQGRRDWDADAFLRAHNEHLALVAVLVFKVLFVTVGLTSYWPYVIVLLLTHLACAGVLFALLRSWSSNEVAVAGTTILLFLGTAWEVLLWPFELGITTSLALGMGAVLALQRRTRGGDVAACALLVGSLAAASAGIPILIIAAVLVLSARGAPRRLWVPAIPTVLYGAWYLAYADSTSRAENIPQIPVYAADAGAAALAGVFGMNPEIGRSLFVAAVIATVAAAVGHRADGARLTAVWLAAGVMWALICLSRFGIALPSSPRYVYPGAVFMLLVLATLLGPRVVSSPRARAVGVVLIAVSITTNIGSLRVGSAQWRDYSGQVQAALGAMTEVRDRVPADFQPAPVYGPQIRAGTYFAAADELGSPAWDDAQIRAGSPTARTAADDVLRRAGAITLAGAPPPPTAAAPPADAIAENGMVTPGPGPGCITGTPLPNAPMTVRLPVPEAGLQVRSATGAASGRVGVRVGRYLDLSGPGDPMASAPRDGTTLVVTPNFSNRSAWRLAAASTGTVVICTVR